ncbi:cation:proton antiporter subunit C [Hirschia maritima]|uniref:cation:proton antiporter subunit C n=1 Tax=Hirschia maritima TaxID=1121961 RepID=UPI000374EEA7|nr:cation:proton antiporter subunit C [Hirschia maritima]
MQFVLDHYNYWIIILLMMGGLYILFESQNLIKRLVGLSIFQTSVIVLYVTLGKVAGGTAPIFVGGGHHGDEHGDETTHGDHATAHGPEAAVASHGEVHENGYHIEPSEGHADASHIGDALGEEAVLADVVEPAVELTHHGDETVQDVAHSAKELSHDTASHGADAAHGAVEVIYSNPLPHVLMLTAIVVGVATLSVGLALVVRIREAYGTIEMDDVNAADIAAGEMEGEKA